MVDISVLLVYIVSNDVKKRYKGGEFFKELKKRVDKMVFWYYYAT